ncbi:MAG: hypothetical protein FWH52_01080 [Synergistaceae bacterium]|nr:hypothetical protein [Synergistaceae bacterium]
MFRLYGVVIFFLILTALLSIVNLNIFRGLKDNRFFDSQSRSKGRRHAKCRGVLAKLLCRNELKFQSILKNSRFETNIGGFIRLKILFGALGTCCGILLKNPLLAIILAGGFYCLPDIYFRIVSVTYSKAIDEKIEATMGIITNSYLQNEDILQSVSENLNRIESPLKEVFREFSAETGFIDASVPRALIRMKHKVDNVYFGDWCDVLIQCQDDRELKYVLPSIASKLGTVKRIQTELDRIMTDIYKEFMIVVAMVVINVPAMAIINREWFDILIGTPAGKITVALSALMIFIASAYVVSVNKTLVRMQ